MKKFLIGCGIFALVVIVAVCIAGGVFAYWGVNKGMELATAIKQAQEDYAKLDSQYPFDEPETLELDPERLDSFFQARAALVQKAKSVPAISKIVNTPEGQRVDLGVRDGASMGFYIAAGMHKDITAALTEAQMSPDEYQWHVRAVYLTLQKGKDAGDTAYVEAFDEIAAGMGWLKGANVNIEGHDLSGDLDGALGSLGRGTVPDANLQTLKPHLSKLTTEPKMALLDIMVFGLLNDSDIRRRGRTTTSADPQPADESEPAPDAVPVPAE